MQGYLFLTNGNFAYDSYASIHVLLNLVPRLFPLVIEGGFLLPSVEAQFRRLYFKHRA